MNRTIVLAFCLGVSGLANATTHTYNSSIEVCTQAPADGSTQVSTAYPLNNQVSGFQTAQYWNGSSWQDWSWMTCEVRDTNLWIVFDGSTNNWPTSWPDVRCAGQLNGETHEVIIDIVPSATCSSTAGVQAGRVAIAAYANSSLKFMTAESLPQATFDHGVVVQARLSPNSSLWGGLTCVVERDDPADNTSTSRLHVAVTGAAIAGSGYCDMPRDADGDGDVDSSDDPMRIGVDLDRLP